MNDPNPAVTNTAFLAYVKHTYGDPNKVPNSELEKLREGFLEGVKFAVGKIIRGAQEKASGKIKGYYSGSYHVNFGKNL